MEKEKRIRLKEITSCHITTEPAWIPPKKIKKLKKYLPTTSDTSTWVLQDTLP